MHAHHGLRQQRRPAPAAWGAGHAGGSRKAVAHLHGEIAMWTAQWEVRQLEWQTRRVVRHAQRFVGAGLCPGDLFCPSLAQEQRHTAQLLGALRRQRTRTARQVPARGGVETGWGTGGSADPVPQPPSVAPLVDFGVVGATGSSRQAREELQPECGVGAEGSLLGPGGIVVSSSPEERSDPQRSVGVRFPGSRGSSNSRAGFGTDVGPVAGTSGSGGSGGGADVFRGGDEGDHCFHLLELSGLADSEDEVGSASRPVPSAMGECLNNAGGSTTQTEQPHFPLETVRLLIDLVRASAGQPPPASRGMCSKCNAPL
jgi:hypothetical protein